MVILGDRFGASAADALRHHATAKPGDSTQQLIVQYTLPYQRHQLADMKRGFEYPIDSPMSLLVRATCPTCVDVPAMTFDSIQNLQGSEYQVSAPD